jgi:hypothetical protein
VIEVARVRAGSRALVEVTLIEVPGFRGPPCGGARHGSDGCVVTPRPEIGVPSGRTGRRASRIARRRAGARPLRISRLAHGASQTGRRAGAVKKICSSSAVEDQRPRVLPVPLRPQNAVMGLANSIRVF